MTPVQARPSALARPVIATVVQQHAEESAMLSHIRSVLVRAPHVGLLQLGRLDERIAAHLDGLAVAGPAGVALCRAALERPGAGEVFAAAVLSLESRDTAGLDDLLALAATLPDAWRGVARALGWVSAAELQGVVRQLLGAAEPSRRCLGLAACRMHGVDPGPAIDHGLADTAPSVRAAALRAGAELGRRDILDRAVGLVGDDHPDVVFWAAWAACLLGDAWRRCACWVSRLSRTRRSPAARCRWRWLRPRPSRPTTLRARSRMRRSPSPRIPCAGAACCACWACSAMCVSCPG
jgi:uncharacterized protein (TIGR02270 family)